MATVEGSWLRQGFFVLGNAGLMPSVRDELERSLNLHRGTLHISNYPVATNWKHTYWWREGDIEYAEAQFVAQIAQDYPVLSLGVAIEKGLENAPATTRPEKLMDRRLWDWPRLTEHVETLLSTDVVATAASLRGPINLRIRNKPVQDGHEHGWHTRAFAFLGDTWFERYVGRVEPDIIAGHVRDLDRQQDQWAIVHFAIDLGPAEADGLSASDVAMKLMAFNGLRRRLRGSLETHAV